MNIQIFHAIKKRFSDEIKWQSRKELVAAKRRKQNAEFLSRRIKLRERQRNARASTIYRECKG